MPRKRRPTGRARLATFAVSARPLAGRCGHLFAASRSRWRVFTTPAQTNQRRSRQGTRSRCISAAVAKLFQAAPGQPQKLLRAGCNWMRAGELERRQLFTWPPSAKCTVELPRASRTISTPSSGASISQTQTTNKFRLGRRRPLAPSGQFILSPCLHLTCVLELRSADLTTRNWS